MRTRPLQDGGMTGREVLTIQCGHYANHVGTHWWNLQEGGLWHPPLNRGEKDLINSDCTFREGLTLSGKETYTPRLLCLDLPGSLNTLKEDGCLYDNTTSPTINSDVEVYKAPVAEKNTFLTDLDRIDKEEIKELPLNSCDGLDHKVEVWSDYLRPHLHPKSIVMLPGYRHKDDTFNVWSAGLDVWRNRKLQRELEDRLHFFVEECDSLQGFQLLTDVGLCGGFSAVSVELAQYLGDEYTHKPLLTVLAMQPGSEVMTRQKTTFSILNSSLAISELTASCDLVVPVSLFESLWPHSGPPRVTEDWNYEVSVPYHTSAIMASLLETCTSPYRHIDHCDTLASITGLLNNGGRKVCSASLSLPFSLPVTKGVATGPPVTHTTPLLSSLISLTPHVTMETTVQLYNQSVSIRGQNDVNESLYSRLIHQLYSDHPSTNSGLTVAGKPLVCTPPYPKILGNTLTTYKDSCSSLQSHTSIKPLLLSLLQHTKSCNLCLAPSYTSTCLDPDSYQELLTSLTDLSQLYQVGPPSDCSTDEEN